MVFDAEAFAACPVATAEGGDGPEGGEGDVKGKGRKGRRPRNAQRVADRTKDLIVTLFGEERRLGTFPTTLCSDMLHLVDMLRRGKRARLARERVAALEEALAADGSVYKTESELRGQIDAWRSQGKKAFDADKYYDVERTAGYTEAMRGPQETLTKRTLQFCSISTVAPSDDAQRESLLALDLGCGSGLSSLAAARIPGYRMGVISVDLSTEMLRSESWEEARGMSARLAAERVKCDLGQGLPFRAGVFDVGYSVSAVHYLAQDAAARSGAERVTTFLKGLRECLAPGARPCALQAFLTKEAGAAQTFMDVAAKSGWPFCQLVVDQSHGTTAERDFLYLRSDVPEDAHLARPARCPLHARADAPPATCALALDEWVQARGLQWPVRLDPAHRAWLEREHGRFAKRLGRLGGRSADGASLDHASAEEAAAAKALHTRLAPVLTAESDDADRLARIIAALHADL